MGGLSQERETEKGTHRHGQTDIDTKRKTKREKGRGGESRRESRGERR